MRQTPRIVLFCAVSLLLAGNHCLAETIEAQSAITQVTVYPGSSLISRAAALKLSAGVHQVTFGGIIPELDDSSLRVSGFGTAEVKILGAQVKREYLEEKPAQKVRELQEEIEKLQDDGRALSDAKNVLENDKQFLDSVRLFAKVQVPKDLATRMPPPQELEETYKFLDAKLKDGYAQAQDLDIKKRQLDKKLEALNNELAQISGGANKLKRYITVDLDVAKAGNLDLAVSYMVGGASWQPLYDARADFDASQITLTSFGVVRQTTGDDWNDVEMSLSTAKPSISGRMPYVSPWFLKPAVFALRRADAAGLMLAAKSVNAPEPSAQYQAFDEVQKDKEEKVSEAQIAQAQTQEMGTSVIYKLSGKATVKPDGSEHKLPILTQTLKADFEYSAYPRLSHFAYLGSRVTNAKDLQLLAGRVNVFLQGDFVGVSSIDNVGPQEEFDLYLGVDENVKVKREEVTKKMDDVLIAGIPAPNRKVTCTYKLTVENYKSKKIKVNLFEALPVSQDERIRVKITDTSVEPKDKDWKDRKGIWRWELGLEPKAKQEIIYTYTVEYPRGMQVEGF